MKSFARTLAVLASSFAICSSAFAATTWPGNTPGTQIVLGNQSTDDTTFESSGAVWNPATSKVYVVDDEGWIASMSSGGSGITYVNVQTGLDMESIATTGTGSYIYAGIEYFNSTTAPNPPSSPQIRELVASTMALSGKTWWLNMPADSSHGMEGLTWVPNGDHPYPNNGGSGGVFYASSQKDGAIYVFDVDLSAGSSTPLSPIDSFTPDSTQTDISDLYFDPVQRILFVLYDSANQLIEIDTSTNAYSQIATYSLPGTPTDQEGVTLLPHCSTGTTTIYLACDASNQGVYSFTGYPEQCAATPQIGGDATIDQNNPDTKYGTASTLTADGSSINFLIRFAKSSNTSQVVRARLLFFVTDDTPSAPNFCSTSTNWDQTTVTWKSAPQCSGSLAGGGASVTSNAWMGYDVTSAYKKSAGFRFVGSSGNDFVANSSEAALNDPYLLVWIQKSP